MKKLIISLIIILSIRNVFGQSIGSLPYTYHLDKQAPVLGSMLIAGVAEGFSDYLSFHYDGNSQFFQPDISWTNKYKNHDVAQGMTFKGKYFVFLTDGWHMCKAINHISVLSAISFKIGEKPKKWYWYIFEAVTYYTANRAGFLIGYHLIKIK